jgi:mycothiol synthase
VGLPDGYRLRAPTQDDFEGAADVLVADELDDTGRVVLDANFLRSAWSRAGFELATDAWVVADAGGTIVAYGQATRDGPSIVESWGIVHPGQRGRGIGSVLLDRIEARASEMLAGEPSARFRHAINASDRAGASMLLARGLQPVRHFWHMQIDLAGPIDPGPPPAGIDVTGIRSPVDLPAIHALITEAFSEHWGSWPEPYEQWVDEEATGPSYDPTLWLLAKESGQPVGTLTATLWGDRGWIGYLGVLARGRGRGIGAGLLRRSFAIFADRGARIVLLNVDSENTTGATALYERVGMRVVKRWDLWERSTR